jgi:hypothetical protein
LVCQIQNTKEFFKMVMNVEKIRAPSSLSERAYEAIKESILKIDMTQMKDLFTPFGESSTGGQFLKYSDANIEFHELVLKTGEKGTGK